MAKAKPIVAVEIVDPIFPDGPDLVCESGALVSIQVHNGRLTLKACGPHAPMFTSAVLTQDEGEWLMRMLQKGLA